MLNFVSDKWEKLQDYLNNKGIPLLLFHDQGKPSVSLTLLIASFALCAVGILEIVKDVDLDKTENLFMICSGLYFGRKLTKDDKNKKIDLTESINPTQGDKPSAST